jgi:NADH-quinone oxidoreductase subunit K
VSHSLEAYLVLSVLLFGIGVFGFLAKRNAIAIGAFTPELAAQASTIALFVIAVAAGEATVGLAIVIAIYRNRRTPLVDEYASMHD